MPSHLATDRAEDVMQRDAPLIRTPRSEQPAAMWTDTSGGLPRSALCPLPLARGPRQGGGTGRLHQGWGAPAQEIRASTASAYVLLRFLPRV
eukprot:2278881-Pyramimonas_sp.AAC.1